MVVFGGWLFGLALELQDGLGESPLRAGLTFVPCGVAFALVSLNWRRLPARYHALLPMRRVRGQRRRAALAGLLLRSGGTRPASGCTSRSRWPAAGMAGRSAR